MLRFARPLYNNLRQLQEEHAALLFRLAVSAAVVVGASLVAPRAAMGSRMLALPLLLVVAALGALALLKWPWIGPPLIVFSGLLVPFSIGTGTQSELNISVLLVGFLTVLWVFDFVVWRRGIEKVISRPVLPLVGFMAVTVLAFAFGQFNWFPSAKASFMAQVGGLAIYILCPFALLLAAFRMNRLSHLQWLVWTFLFIGGLFVAGNLIPPLGRIIIPFYERGANDSLFWTWLTILSFSQAVFNKRLPMWARGGLGLLTAATFYITFVQKAAWTSGWLPAAAGVAVTVLIANPRLGAAGLIATLIAYIIRSQQVVDTVMVGDNQYSLLTRLEAWRIMWKIISVSPVFGLGPANYYWYTALFPILGYAVYFNSHNNYVDMLAQIGFAGALLFLWFAAELGWLAIRLRSRVPEGFARAFLYAAVGGLAGTLVSGMLGDWILPFIYNVGLDGFRASVIGWMFLGGIILLERLYGQKAAA